MIWQKRQRHFENTLKGRSLRLVTFETFNRSDEETWHDQQRQRHSENTTTNTYEIKVWNCCHFRQLGTWVHDNHCYLGIKSDTGQHSQFLRCFNSDWDCRFHTKPGRYVYCMYRYIWNRLQITVEVESFVRHQSFCQLVFKWFALFAAAKEALDAIEET